jgi:hypothetical protein
VRRALASSMSVSVLDILDGVALVWDEVKGLCTLDSVDEMRFALLVVWMGIRRNEKGERERSRGDVMILYLYLYLSFWRK